MDPLVDGRASGAEERDQHRLLQIGQVDLGVGDADRVGMLGEKSGELVGKGQVGLAEQRAGGDLVAVQDRPARWPDRLTATNVTSKR